MEFLKLVAEIEDEIYMIITYQNIGSILYFKLNKCNFSYYSRDFNVPSHNNTISRKCWPLTILKNNCMRWGSLFNGNNRNRSLWLRKFTRNYRKVHVYAKKIQQNIIYWRYLKLIEKGSWIITPYISNNP